MCGYSHCKERRILQSGTRRQSSTIIFLRQVTTQKEDRHTQRLGLNNKEISYVPRFTVDYIFYLKTSGFYNSVSQIFTKQLHVYMYAYELVYDFYE